MLKKVKKIHQNTTDILVKIKTKLDTIVTTPEHPFYIKGKYILAGFLSAGMSLTGFEYTGSESDKKYVSKDSI